MAICIHMPWLLKLNHSQALITSDLCTCFVCLILLNPEPHLLHSWVFALAVVEQAGVVGQKLPHSLENPLDPFEHFY